MRLTAATGVVHSTKEATGDIVQRSGLKPLWSDDYFIMGNHLHHGKPGAWVRIRVRSGWKVSLGGTAPMSKQFDPTTFEETRTDPVRTILVLRAWSMWRARINRWGEGKKDRRTHFAEQEAFLERDVKCLNARCRLLGHSVANAAFRECVPDIAKRLRRTGV